MKNTKQQAVFNAAWNGLKKSGWKKTAAWEDTYAPAIRYDRAGRVVCRCACATVEHKLNSMSVIEDAGLSYLKLADCHDEATSPADMRKRLRNFAKAHGLTVPRTSLPK